MSNLEKFNNVFADVFSVAVEQLNDDFSKEIIANWDSVRQLSLVTALEEEFDIMLETEEIIAITSYLIAKNILANYDIEL